MSDEDSEQQSGPHPRDTGVLYGHQEAERALAEAYASGRLPHAWLIGGPKGLGKATLAYRFARILLAGARVDPSAPAPLAMARETPAFRFVSAEAHPDLLVLRRPYDEKAKKLKTQIPVDEVRRIHSLFGHRAGGQGYRVCIVDAADDLGPGAANALLKTLEEPPARSVFLLIAHAPQRLLPTIRSRCRKLTLKALARAEIEAVLAERLPALPAADRRQLVLLAEGRPGRALALAEADGLALSRTLTQLLESLPKPDPERVHALAERLSRPAEEEAYRTTIELLRSFLSRLVRNAADMAGPDTDPRELALHQRLAATGSLERWAELWEKINGLVARADAVALDRRQVVLTSFGALARVASGASCQL